MAIIWSGCWLRHDQCLLLHTSIGCRALVGTYIQCELAGLRLIESSGELIGRAGEAQVSLGELFTLLVQGWQTTTKSSARHRPPAVIGHPHSIVTDAVRSIPSAGSESSSITSTISPGKCNTSGGSTRSTPGSIHSVVSCC